VSGVVAPKAEVALKAVGFAGVFLGLCVRSSAVQLATPRRDALMSIASPPCVVVRGGGGGRKPWGFMEFVGVIGTGAVGALK
jgi:hypothetical protein